MQWAGLPCAQRGDLNIYSFHATKVYNTLEGGAITGDDALVARLKRRRNFGLSREEQFSFGTNGKMDELRAAVGLLNLRTVDAAIAARARVARFYLDAIPGETDLLQLFPELLFPRDATHNHAYFPARVHSDAPLTRDGLLDALKTDGILARRYFYPTPTTSSLYREHVPDDALPETRRCSRDTICLPIHPQMSRADCAHVVDSLVRALGREPPRSLVNSPLTASSCGAGFIGSNFVRHLLRCDRAGGLVLIAHVRRSPPHLADVQDNRGLPSCTATSPMSRPFEPCSRTDRSATASTRWCTSRRRAM